MTHYRLRIRANNTHDRVRAMELGMDVHGSNISVLDVDCPASLTMGEILEAMPGCTIRHDDVARPDCPRCGDSGEVDLDTGPGTAPCSACN
jgi:hypothetical protein